MSNTGEPAILGQLGWVYPGKNLGLWLQNDIVPVVKDNNFDWNDPRFVAITNGRLLVKVQLQQQLDIGGFADGDAKFSITAPPISLPVRDDNFLGRSLPQGSICWVMAVEASMIMHAYKWVVFLARC